MPFPDVKFYRSTVWILSVEYVLSSDCDVLSGQSGQCDKTVRGDNTDKQWRGLPADTIVLIWAVDRKKTSRNGIFKRRQSSFVRCKVDFSIGKHVKVDWESRIMQMIKIDKVTTLIVEYYITLLLHVCVDTHVQGWILKAMFALHLSWIIHCSIYVDLIIL